MKCWIFAKKTDGIGEEKIWTNAMSATVNQITRATKTKSGSDFGRLTETNVDGAAARDFMEMKCTKKILGEI